MGGFFLTEAILELILASLPLHSLARFRSVCQTWNALIVSASFARLLSSFPSSNADMDTVTDMDTNTETCVGTDKREIWVLRQDKWCHKVEAFPCHLPSSSSSSSSSFSPSRWLFACPFAVAASRRVLASDRGLVLLALSDSFKTLPHPYLVVWNPLRSSWRELPASSLFKDGFVFAFCFAHDEDSGTFKVLLSSFTEVNYYSTAHSSPIAMIHRTEVFDSRSGAWEQGSPTLLRRRRKCTSNVVWFQGHFHCVLDGRLWSYNLHDKVWSQTLHGMQSETRNETWNGTQNEIRNGMQHGARTDTLNQSRNEIPNRTLNETLIENLTQTQHETGNRTRNHALTQTRNETLNQTANETQNEALTQTQTQTQHEIQNRTRNETLVPYQNETRNQSQDQTRSETQNETQNEVIKETLILSQNETLNQNGNKTRNETLNQTHHETQNRTQSNTLIQSRNETQNEARNGTGNQTQHETQSRSRNGTLIQTQTEAPNQTRNETGNRPQIETQNRTLNVTQNETRNQTQTETGIQPLNETQNRTRNEIHSETRNVTRTGTVVEPHLAAPAPFTILAASGKGLYKIPFEAGIPTLSAFRMGTEGGQDWVRCHRLPEDLCSILWDEEAGLWNIWRDWRECCILGEHVFFCLGKKNLQMLLYNVVSNRFRRLDNIPPPLSSSSDCTLHFIFQPGFRTAL